MRMKLRFFFMIGMIALMIACNKNKNHPVPIVPTNVTININLPSYVDLNNVGGWAYVNGGSKGIIVYRRAVDDFVAWDRHSPADNGSCNDPLVPDTDNFLQLNDACSDATFSLFDGSPLSESEFGLRAYQTYWDGVDELRIYN